MENKAFVSLMLVAFAGVVLGGTQVSHSVFWSGPEPSGIVAFTK